MNNKTHQKAYSDAKKIISDCINNWDPMGLFPDAPNDEYELEINRIIPQIRDMSSPENTSKIISQMFTEYFDEEFTTKVCTEVANEIFTKLESAQLLMNKAFN
jgi:hypothetical protein